MKAIPQLFGLQMALHRLQVVAIAGANYFGCLLDGLRRQPLLAVLRSGGLGRCGAASLAAGGAGVELRFGWSGCQWSHGAGAVSAFVSHIVVIIIVVVVGVVMVVVVLMVVQATGLGWRLLGIAAIDHINVNLILHGNGTLNGKERSSKIEN